MIRCHLARMMGEHKMCIADVARETGLNRGTITRMYNETATRIELDAIETLCRYLNVKIEDLYEFVD